MGDRPPDYCRPGDIVEVKGLGRVIRQPDAMRYDYHADKLHCPACGRSGGFPWSGWSQCEYCDAAALISTGEVFLPIRPGPDNVPLPTE
jgi:hypothetical protein